MSEPELYFNTTNLSGTELQESRFKAGMLNDKVLLYFRLHPFDCHTPFEIWKKLGINNYPETSIRRSITNLTTLGKLEKLDGKEGRPFVQRKGHYGKLSYAWRIK
jgi:hypothetical protein